MFHPEELLNEAYIRKVWQAANKLPTGTVNVHDLPEICRNMDTLISSESPDVRHKLSLRTSATLINGAARLYRTAGDDILQDVISLHMNITQRKRKLSLDTSVPISKRIKTTNSATFVMEPSSSDTRYKNTRARSQRMRSNESPININNENTTQCEGNLLKDLELTFSSTQTEDDIGISSDNHADCNEDNNLPYGCLMIYKDYNSRLPSCLIFSSLKSDLKQILKEHKML